MSLWSLEEIWGLPVTFFLWQVSDYLLWVMQPKNCSWWFLWCKVFHFEVQQTSINRRLKSGQIIIFHQPGFPWNKGISLTKPPFGVRSCEVAIIWPAEMENALHENLEQNSFKQNSCHKWKLQVHQLSFNTLTVWHTNKIEGKPWFGIAKVNIPVIHGSYPRCSMWLAYLPTFG